MGFVNKLRNELIDIVEWIDDSRHTLVWRFPRYHNQIKNGAQLIVRPGQVAVFVEQGKIAEVFEPGTHTLSTANLPILSTLKGWMHGFDSPFKAEVYFVTTRQITEMKWGTPNPVIVRDPDFGPIRVRAFGTYTIKAIDPEALLRELVGTDGSFESDEITVLLRSIINNAFAEVVAKSGISVIDLASNYADLSEQIRQACINQVDTEYGLDFPQLYIVNISVPEEVEKALDARSSMGMIGHLGAYQQYQLGQAISTAAANPAGGLAAAGIGLGMGMAYTGQMIPTHGNPAAVPPVPSQAGAQWHVAVNGQPTGPFNMLQLQEAVASGQLTGASLVWCTGMSTWAPASTVDDLAVLFTTPPPIPKGQI
ncbi:MAG: antifreeze protein, type I [Candidatus Entotheonella factor]|uniref:Antifreeze protein, type I n=1 Tax=Entotheonella factor TaxID=1429438 RepID=W4LBM7_ENTF1|nr:MAG: antifreeze protein, type I [Candidatus Entotheonella factor]